MGFQRVFGQKRVKSILTSSLERNRLAHAYLFHGQQGIGKDAMALSIAMHMLCVEGVTGGCGTCPACKQVLNIEHPGFHFILPVPTRPKTLKEDKYREILRDRALKRIENPFQEIRYSPEITILPIISIDQIRAMKKEVMLRMSGRGNRVFLVSHAEKMNEAAANSLLKLLEEPPENTMLILTTSSPGRLLKTIVSRCQSVRFDPLSDDQVEEALISQWQYPPQKAHFYAGLSGGSLQRALDLSAEGFEERRDIAVQLFEKAVKGGALEWVDLSEGLSRENQKAEVAAMLQILLMWLRDLYQIQLGLSGKILNVDGVDRLNNFHRAYPHYHIENSLRAVERAIDYIEKNVYLQVVLFELCKTLNESSNKTKKIST